MELPISMGGSAAATSLVNLKMVNHKRTSGLGPQLQFSHDVPSSACLMIFNKECSKRINYKVCRALQAVSPVQCAENPMQAPVAFKDFHVSVLTEEDGVIEVAWHFALSNRID
ncbi:unnamed protein product [Triticum turgidum subsp. durum]|uniref:Uncharacterized protein n=1 Tax=Triticum turgidum subsp. durum TaxID=4567 RepID=A0A9R0TU16_TRITD|nr:unnamed protein product [Triticum turgidum subsp. durum]